MTIKTIKTIRRLMVIFLLTALIVPIISSGQDYEREGKKALKKRLYCEAVRYFQKALENKPDLKSNQKFLKRFNKAAIICYYTRGRQLLSQKNFDEAIFNLEKTLEVDKHHKKALETLQRAKMEKATWLLNNAMEILKKEHPIKKEASDAVSFLMQSLQYDKNNQQAAEKLEEARTILANIDRKIKTLYQRAKNFLRMGIEKKALQELEEILIEDPDFREVKAKIIEIYSGTGKEFEDKNKPGNALIEYIKAYEYNPRDSYLQKKIQDLKTKIHNRITFSICLFPDDLKKDEEINITEDISYEISTVLPGFIRLVHWNEIKDILSVSQQGRQVTFEVRDKETVKLDQIIFIKLVNSKVVPFKIARAAVKAYIADTYREKNPEWERLQRKVDEYERNLKERIDAQIWANRYGNNFTKLSSIIDTQLAAQYHQKAIARLIGENQFVIKQMFDFWHYRVITHIKKAFLFINYRIVDIFSSEIISSGNIKKDDYVKDDVIENPNPSIGIYADTLQLPPDTKITRNLYRLALTEMKRKLIKELRTKNARPFFLEAMEFNLNNNIEEAAEAFINFLLLSGDRQSFNYKKAAQFLETKKSFHSFKYFR